MKHIVRIFLFNGFAIWMTTQLYPALRIGGNWQTLLFAGIMLSILMLVVAPILKILFIPINIITFGLLSWIINVVVIYLLTVFVPEVSIREYEFPGLSWNGFVVPSIHAGYVLSLIIATFSITFFSNLLHKISEE